MSVAEMYQMLDDCVDPQNYTERMEFILFCMDHSNLLVESETLLQFILFTFRRVKETCRHKSHRALLSSFIRSLEPFVDC
jgi:hypothetical protein